MQTQLKPNTSKSLMVVEREGKVARITKPCFIILALFTAMGTFAQSGQKWSTGGNSTSADDFSGTTNSEPLLLKANNQLGIKIKPNGEVIFKPLDLNSATGPNGLILTDGQGKISRLNFNGDLNQVMLGNGPHIFRY